MTDGADDAAGPQGDGSVALPPTVARRLLDMFEQEGLGAGVWMSVFMLRRSLLVRAARDGDVGEFERQFRVLCEVRARCRREGLGGGGERRARWQLVRADLREGCAALSQAGRWPSASLLRTALRTALADRPGLDHAPTLLAGASRQVVASGDAAGARRLLRILEDDLRADEPALAAVPDGAARSIECARELNGRFGAEARRAPVVHALGAGWMRQASAARALEAIDPLLGPPPGAGRPDRDAHAMSLAIAAHAWHLLGDSRESVRLSAMARAAIGRGFLRRWSGRRACAESIAWIVATRD